MEENGISLFQGPEAINIGEDDLRQQEAEEQEDLLRREQEINNIMTNAFDDLDDEIENSSMNSSTYPRQSFVGNSSHCSNSYHDNEWSAKKNLQNDEYLHYQSADNHSHDDSMNLKLVSNKLPISNGFTTTPQIATPVERLPVNYSENHYERVNSELNSEDSFKYPYNFETPAHHFIGDKDYARKNFNDNFEISNTHRNLDKFERLSNESQISNNIQSHVDYHLQNDSYDKSDEIYKTSDYYSKEQLELLYNVKLKEVEKLTNELRQVQIEKNEEINNLQRQLALTQADVQKSNISKNQLQNALVDAKAEISDLKLQISNLTENNEVLKKTKDKLVEELSIAKNSVHELQQKITVLEKIQTIQSNDKIQEKFLQQAEEKHNIELRNMQTQIEVLTNKLSAKESSFISLEQKYADACRTNEALIIEKGEAVNKLAKTLEESQNHCRSLMSKNCSEELQKLQKQLKAAFREKDEILISYKELEHKLNLAKSEAYCNFLISNNSELEEFSKSGASENKVSEDVPNKLQIELQRCLAGHALKRKEITRLENIIAQKDKEINDANNAVKSLKQDAFQYTNRIEDLEKELKCLLTDQAMKANKEIKKLADHLQEVTKQYNTLKSEKEDLEKQFELTNENKRTSYQMFGSPSQEKKDVSVAIQTSNNFSNYNSDETLRNYDSMEKNKEIFQLTMQLEETQKELDRVKEMYVDVCSAKGRLVSEHKEEVQNLIEKYKNYDKDFEKLTVDLEMKILEINNLTKESEVQKNKIKTLERSLEREKKESEFLEKKMHTEIEKAKTASVNEKRNEKYLIKTQENTCAKHVLKIEKLEEECRDLQNRLLASLEKQRTFNHLQNQLERAKLLIEELEITEISLKRHIRRILSQKNENIENSLDNRSLNNRSKETNNLQEKKIEQLEAEIARLAKKDNEMKKIVEERDILFSKLKNQTKQFENYINNRTDIKEIAFKEVRCEMENRVTEELKNIAAQYKNKLKLSQAKLENEISELRAKYEEKDREFESFKETVLAEKMKSHSAVKAKELFLAQIIENKVKSLQKELQAKKLQVYNFEKTLQQKEIELEDDRNVMTQMMTDWVAEIKEIKLQNSQLEEKVKLFNEAEEKYLKEIELLKKTQQELTKDLNEFKEKYSKAKKVISNYKAHSKRKAEHIDAEQKRLEDGYKRALAGVQHKVDMLISTRREEFAQQIQEVRNLYDKQIYKNSSSGSGSNGNRPFESRK